MKNIWLKIERVLLFVFLLLIPTQLGKHFWPEWSYVFGIRVDYWSPTLYLVDLIWIGLFLVSSRGVKRRGDPERDCFASLAMTQKYKKAIFFVLLMVFNIWVAKNHWIAGYKWLRLGQFIWTIWYLKENREILKKFLIYIIPFWIILESLLGLGQIIKGGSLNGFFYWLGERRFNFNTIGVAQMAVFGRGLVRAYGTFSHPNSLAGFLLLSLMIYKLIFNSKFLKNKKNFLLWIVLELGILGIVLTGSRTVIVFSILYLVFSIKSKFKYLILISGIVFLVLFFKTMSGWDKMGLQKRMDLNVATWEMIKQNPLFGTGLGNNVWPQPVHNIILLILSEVGVLGLLIFSFQFSVFKKIKEIFLKKDKSFLLILIIILMTGMADHYWLTLPQNMWLLVIFFALAIK